MHSGPLVILQHVRRVFPNLDASGASQILFRKSAAQHSDRVQPRPARRLRVVMRVPDRYRLLRSNAVEPRQRRLKDVGIRLRALRIVR